MGMNATQTTKRQQAYKAIGNAWARNVFAWLGERIDRVLADADARAPMRRALMPHVADSPTDLVDRWKAITP